MLSSTDKKALKFKGVKTLARWWCELNKWGWPTGLPEPEFHKLSEPGSKRRSEIMNYILGRIGRKACLKEWNRS